ncbi:hypothetical protein [Poseidonibacter ostreae]|uniref:Uncharacterized protein n=1 Tax=Poseidonibacter ostreae TaxID=2654171 RepID=A0A6L4WTU8_9BACT|nr:hypothetical protein [Poseidonibacter ostreae]KAB7889548.1 hypothetical protein GBG19_05695 [Poseidonibacter ostreae]
MKNNTIANTSISLLFMFIIYVSILLTNNTYTTQTLMVFGLISLLGIFIFVGAFVYFKFILKDELFVSKEQADKADIEHFFKEKVESTTEIIKEEKVQTNDKEEKKAKQLNVLTEDPADALAKALEAINSSNVNDSDIKKEF